MFNYMTTFGLEDFTPTQKITVNNIVEVFSEAQRTGSVSGKQLDKIEGLLKKLNGVTYKLKMIPEENAYVKTFPTWNLGGVRNIDTSGMSFNAAKEASYIAQYFGNQIAHLPYAYNQASGQFTGPALKNIKAEIAVGTPFLHSLTAEEVTAILLHEVGHVWVMLMSVDQYHDQSMIAQAAKLYQAHGDNLTGEIRYDLAKNIVKRLDNKKHAALAARLKSGDYTTKEFVEACLLINDDIAIRTQSNATDAIRRRNEQGADNYVVRLGYGLDLATGLQKSGIKPYSSGDRWAYNFASTVALALGVGVTLSCPPAGIMYMISMSISLSYAPSVAEMYSSYDNNTGRHKRIYTTMIGELKKSDLDPQLKKLTIEATEALRDTLEDSYETMGWLSFLNPAFVSNYHGRRQEERIESLINNELYISAAKLEL